MIKIDLRLAALTAIPGSTDLFISHVRYINSQEDYDHL